MWVAKVFVDSPTTPLLLISYSPATLAYVDDIEKQRAHDYRNGEPRIILPEARAG